jgi:hypothetical protein
MKILNKINSNTIIFTGLMGKNLQINKNWIISIITLVCFAAEPVSELIKVSDFVFVDFIEIEKTNQNDILEIDESQFDSEFLNKSKKTIYQFEFDETKSIRPLRLISYTKVDIEVVIPPPDCLS